MAIQIGAKPDSGFDDPIGMLEDCHRRIEHFLGIFRRVAEDAAGRALGAEEQTAVRAALHYFRTAGPRHNADEEQSLFPRLRTGIGTDIFDRMETLERQHREAAGMHATIGHLFEAWMANGALAPRDAVGLRSTIQRLLGLYTEHIRTEETLVFPHARRSLDAAAIAAIGPEFQLRRK